MKKNHQITFAFIATFLSIFLPNTAKAQDSGIENTFLLGRDDAAKILTEYIAPAPKIIGFAMAEGWYFTAQPLKRGRWNIQLNSSTAIGTEKDASYDLATLGLQNTATPNGTQTATIFGGSGTEVVNNKNNKTIELGTGFGEITPLDPSVITLPNLQINIGLRKNTEISLRGLPPINVGSISLRNYGFGIKHDIKQWIPSISLSNFSMAIVANVNYFSLQKGLESSVLRDPATGATIPGPTDRSYKITSLQYGGGIVFSKRIKLLTLMTGLRFDVITGTGELKGTYTVFTPATGGTNTGGDKQTDIGLISLNNSASRIGLNLGAKVKLGKFGVFLHGIVGNYSSFNFGFVFGKNE